MFIQYLLLVSAIVVLGSDVNNISRGEKHQDLYNPEHQLVQKRDVGGELEHSTQATTDSQTECQSKSQPELNAKAKLHKWTWYDILIVVFLILVVIYVRMSLYKREGDNCCFGCKWGRTTTERPETRTGILNQQETET
ncbi:uncharacterized protein LOC108031223 [Drosophila biarmipes]|uniref:uncharacterized protein LOC108031223 n=1 Tax=Drosophila biarmipes TaxID=125945 RepID=UPI0007E5CCB8|nr:uncharacterized protein LOC108031223 [Drosophila biarmipes]